MVLYESRGVQHWKELTVPEETGPRAQCVAPSPSCETLNKLVHLSELILDFKSNTLVVIRDREGDLNGDCYGVQSSTLENGAVLEIN